VASPQLEAALVRRLRNNAVRLPPYPAVVARLKKLATAPNVDLTQLATVLSSDPALAGVVIANASQVEGPVTTLAAALARLDVKELTGIVLAADLGRAAVLGGPLSPLRRDAWRCALLSARIAQELAPARGISPDEAHLAGLLHNFGAMVVIATLEDIAAEQPLPPLPQAAWSALVDKLQVEFGLLTAIRWGLPRSLIEVIEHHGDPSTPLEYLIDLVDEIIATLDRVPAAGVTALLGIDELTPVECARIAIVITQVVKQMASFAPLSTRHVPVIIPPIDGEDTWPIDLGIQIRQGTYRACALSPSAIMFTGPAPGSGVRNSIIHQGAMTHGYFALVGDLTGALNLNNTLAPPCDGAGVPC